MKKADIPAYKALVRVGSLEFRDKLMVYLSNEGYRKNKTYKFTIKELYEITGIKIESWNNWKQVGSIPAHVLVLLHVYFDIDLIHFFETNELKKISREGRENVCA